jgi:hypothetical protein
MDAAQWLALRGRDSGAGIQGHKQSQTLSETENHTLNLKKVPVALHASNWAGQTPKRMIPFRPPWAVRSGQKQGHMTCRPLTLPSPTCFLTRSCEANGVRCSSLKVAPKTYHKQAAKRGLG